MNAVGKIKVAVLTPNPTPYRVPFFRYLAAMEEIDLEVFFLTKGSPSRPWQVDIDGFKHEFLTEYAIPIGGKDKARYRVNPGVFSRLRQGRFDAVAIAGYNHFTTQAAIAYCTVTRTPWCLMCESHVKKHRGRFKTFLKKWLLGPFLSRMGAAMVTGTLAARYVEGFGVPPEATFVVANTPDVEHWKAQADKLENRRDQIRRRLGAEDRRIVLFVGRLMDVKGLPVLFDAYQKAKEHDNRLALFIVGDGAKRADYQRRAREMGLEDVNWLGFRSQEELPELYVAADVFVLPSLVEPWGVVVNEAMASGLPVVLSDHVGASADLVHEGENGFVVPAGDAEALSQRILEAVADDNRRLAMGKKSREIISGWDYHRSAQNFRDAVKTAISRGGAQR